MSAEPPKLTLRAARQDIFERTFGAIVFMDVVSVRHVMDAVNCWVNKPKGEGTFTLQEARSALEAMSAREVIHLAGDTVFFPPTTPDATSS